MCSTRVYGAVAGVGGNVVVWHRQGGLRPPHLAPGQPQAFESLGTHHLMDQVPVDIEGASAVLDVVHQMVFLRSCRTACAARTCRGVPQGSSYQQGEIAQSAGDAKRGQCMAEHRLCSGSARAAAATDVCFADKAVDARMLG